MNEPKRISLTDLYDPIQLANQLAAEEDLAETVGQVLTNGQAREYATDCIVSIVHAVFQSVENARAIVDADERLDHLSDDEKQIVADLIDHCRATVECDFDWEEAMDGGSDTPDDEAADGE